MLMFNILLIWTLSLAVVIVLVLAVYLIGTTLGAAAYSRWMPDARRAERLRDRLLQTLAAACVLGTLCLAGAETLKAALSETLGTSMAAALAGEAALATAAFLLPTLVMGALFGLVGAIIAVPAATILKTLWEELYLAERVRDPEALLAQSERVVADET